MVKYEKTPQDIAREQSDLDSSPIMRFLKSKERFKFNIGDIVIKKSRWHKDKEYKVETLRGIDAPKKYMYVFENELGIGYIKQLRVDGSGFTSNLICVANFDPDFTMFELDPDYADHLIIGQDTFTYNEEYAAKKKFREEAIKKNRAMLVKTRSSKSRMAWFESLKQGDKFWYGDTFEDLANNCFEVVNVVDQPLNTMPRHVAERMGDDLKFASVYRIMEANRLTNVNKYNGGTLVFSTDHFAYKKISMQEPYPLVDPLCGQQR